MPADGQLDALVAAVLASAKYRALAPDLVRRVGAAALASEPTLKAATKAAKARLHQIAGAYVAQPPRYGRWLAELRAAADGPERRAVCAALMEAHASTRERLPHLGRIYPAVFAGRAPATVLDLACGLNPLAIPWMGLPATTRYLAADIYTDLRDFLAAALPLLGVAGDAAICDLAGGPPAEPADLALVLKTLPVLEQQRRGAGSDLLRALRAPRLVVSFPTRSLGGRDVGMAASYGGQMRALAAAEGWPLQTIELPNELVFLIEKP